MSLDPYAAEWEARGFPPDEPSSRCAEAREWLELARASFEAGEPTQTCYRSRVAAWLSTQLPDEVGPAQRWWSSSRGGAGSFVVLGVELVGEQLGDRAPRLQV